MSLDDGGPIALESRAELVQVFAASGDAAMTLADGFLRGQEVWPTVDLDPQRFVEVVTGLANARPGPLRATVATLRLDEIYLAAGCADGNSGAIVAFEDAFFGEIPRAFSSRSHDEAFLDDARQNLRELLFVGRSGQPPEISRYGGRGSLRRWFRLVLVHHTLNYKRAEARAPVPADLKYDQLLLAPGDPELVYLRQRYSADFRAATEEAVQRVAPEDRLILQHHYVERLSIDRIGAIYGIHRVTAARRVNKARDEFVQRVREALTARLHLEERELLSILRLLPTQFSLSFRRVLASA
jgi:RNA polymerase sigma-70 factor (ECF subfamily)